MFSIGAETFAAYEGNKVSTYENMDCTIIYTIANEWSGNQQVNVAITNNGDETIRNWAVAFDSNGSISSITELSKPLSVILKLKQRGS